MLAVALNEITQMKYDRADFCGSKQRGEDVVPLPVRAPLKKHFCWRE
jgi:hypothetical protein